MVHRSTGKQGENCEIRWTDDSLRLKNSEQWRRATYTDEVVLWEATRRDVILQQLLGEVLVHLRCFVGIHCVSQGLV